MKDLKTYKNRTGLIGNKLAQCNAISQELYGGDFYEVEPWNRMKVIHTFNLRAQNGAINEVKPFTPTPYQEKARRSLRKGHAIAPVTALEIQAGKNYCFVETMVDNEINRRAFCQGHRDVVPRGKALFVLWGGVHCYFCKRCLRIIHRASLKGREATPEELQKRRKG